jgi:hypothetical protein
MEPADKNCLSGWRKPPEQLASRHPSAGVVRVTADSLPNPPNPAEGSAKAKGSGGPLSMPQVITETSFTPIMRDRSATSAEWRVPGNAGFALLARFAVEKARFEGENESVSNTRLRGLTPPLMGGRSRSRFFSFPNSVWERTLAKLCFARGRLAGRETEFRRGGSQTEFGNQAIRRTVLDRVARWPVCHGCHNRGTPDSCRGFAASTPATAGVGCLQRNEHPLGIHHKGTKPCEPCDWRWR